MIIIILLGGLLITLILLPFIIWLDNRYIKKLSERYYVPIHSDIDLFREDKKEE